MIVGMFTDSYLPYTSGVVRSIEMTTGELRQRGHEVYIFAPSYGDETDEKLADPFVYRLPSVAAPTFKDFHVAIPWSPGLVQKVQDLGIQVIHSHSPFILGGVGAAAARRNRLPLVFTFHTRYDLYTHYWPWGQGFARRVVTDWARLYANNAQRVLAPSASLAQYLTEIGVTAPVEVLPTGIHTQLEEQPDTGWLRRELQLGPDDRIALYAGRLGPEKNLDVLFDAFALVAEADRRVHFAIAGGGVLRDALQERSSIGPLQGRVHFLGLLDRDRMRDAYAGAEVFAFASLTETQGLVLAEAMAVGLVPVAVAAPGSSDTIEDRVSGILTANDPEAIAAAIKGVLSDAEWRSRLQQGSRCRAEQFSIAVTTDRLCAIYDELQARVKVHQVKVHQRTGSSRL